MSNLVAATVDIKLAGEPVTLNCTLEAAMGINKFFGGLYAAHNRILAGDMEALVTVIRHGAGMNAKEAEALPARVFLTGVINLTTPLTRFVTLLADGGRVIEKDDPAAGEA